MISLDYVVMVCLYGSYENNHFLCHYDKEIIAFFTMPYIFSSCVAVVVTVVASTWFIGTT